MEDSAHRDFRETSEKVNDALCLESVRRFTHCEIVPRGRA
jgi:hypothetical protein